MTLRLSMIPVSLVSSGCSSRVVYPTPCPHLVPTRRVQEVEELGLAPPEIREYEVRTHLSPG